MAIKLDSAKFRFVQDGNTLGSTQETEVIEVSILTQLPGELPFVVIKSEGWSIDSINELADLIDKCLKFSNDFVGA